MQAPARVDRRAGQAADSPDGVMTSSEDTLNNRIVLSLNIGTPSGTGIRWPPIRERATMIGSRLQQFGEQHSSLQAALLLELLKLVGLRRQEQPRIRCRGPLTLLGQQRGIHPRHLASPSICAGINPGHRDPNELEPHSGL